MWVHFSSTVTPHLPSVSLIYIYRGKRFDYFRVCVYPFSRIRSIQTKYCVFLLHTLYLSLQIQRRVILFFLFLFCNHHERSSCSRLITFNRLVKLIRTRISLYVILLNRTRHNTASYRPGPWMRTRDAVDWPRWLPKRRCSASPWGT